MNKKQLDPRLMDRRPMRLRLLTTSLTLATAGILASNAAEVTFKYVRFTSNQNFNTTTNTQIQLSEFIFRHQGTILNINNSTGVGANIPVSITGGTNAPTANEGAMKVGDGSVDTKWFNGTRTAPLLFNFDTPVTFDWYNFATANDSLDRTPAGWILEGSNDGTNFVTIDTRTDIAIIPTFKTYQDGWEVTGGAAIPTVAAGVTAPAVTDPITYGVASPATVLTGGSSSLSWTSANATAGSAILNPGAVPVADSGTQSISPTGLLTPYLISATNASATTSSTVNVRVVPGATASYTYVRFTPISLRNNATANSIQIGEFEFFNGASEVEVIAATNPGGNAPVAEPPFNLIDGDPATKWLDFNKRGIVFDFGEEKSFDSYQIVTANDATERDPVRWILEGSNDYDTWTLIDAVAGADYPTPTRRVTGTGVLPLSGRTLAWKDAANGTWDTATQNFNPTSGAVATTTFSDGDAVSFGDNAASTNVVIASAVAPSHLGFYNNDASYTLSGAPINGQGQLVKHGLGSLTLGSANNFTGELVLNGGTLVAQAPGSLGPRYVRKELIFEGSSTLTVPVSLNSARTMTIRPQGASTINVASGATFLHYGKINFGDTLTKTGTGLLRFEDYIGSSNSASEDLVINEGAVEFGNSHFNSAPLGGRTMVITVNSGGILRTTASHALGGDQIDGSTSVAQIRAFGGTLQFNGFTYLATGFAGEDGRTLLQGAVIEGTAQIESANSFQANAETNPEQRATISTLASATTSEIRGTGVLNCNSGHWLFRVAEGEAQDDLVISRQINGTYGIIKEGPGNLVLTGDNIYVGTSGVATDGDLRLPLPDGTTVRAGTLTVRNATGSATGAGSVLVQAGATLAGSGTITGATAVAGMVSPGENGIGTLAVGSTTLTGGTYASQINGATADKLVVNGNLNVTGGILAISATAPTESSYVVATYTGDLTGTLEVIGLPEGYQLSVNAAAKQIEVKQSTGSDTYEDWATGLSDPSADADEDGDGMANGIEFVVGSDAEQSGQDKLPTFTRSENGDFVFTFLRTERSSYLNPVVEYSTNLGEVWTTFGGAVVSAPVDGVATVTATLPASLAPDGKIFARLRVEIP